MQENRSNRSNITKDINLKTAVHRRPADHHHVFTGSVTDKISHIGIGPLYLIN